MTARTCRWIHYCLLGCLFLSGGCAPITETSRKIWGSSTSALQRARADGIRKTYACSVAECFTAVLALGRSEEEQEAKARQEEEAKKEGEEGKTPALTPGAVEAPKAASDAKFFDIFLKDPRQRHMIVMGIAGNVDTTEAGIFFDAAGTGTTIEISSLSTTAKRRVAQAVFDELDKQFSPGPAAP